MKVAAVVPHWNRRDLLQTLLANLAEQTRAFDEIIVVDNGSTDDSAAVAERAGAKVVRLERNLGFAAAVNRGYRSGRNADWIAILNNDVTLAPDWLEQLLAAAEKEQAWFATGKTLSANDPTRIDGTFDAISRGRLRLPLRFGKAGRTVLESTAPDPDGSHDRGPVPAAAVRGNRFPRRRIRVVPGGCRFRNTLRDPANGGGYTSRRRLRTTREVRHGDSGINTQCG